MDVSIDVESTESVTTAATAAPVVQDDAPEAASASTSALDLTYVEEPVIVVPVRPKARRHSLPPIIKKTRSNQILPEPPIE
jgi:hypothetical protein